MTITTRLLGVAIAVVLAACTANPTLQTGPDAEVTFDGLTKVDRTVMDAAWVRAGTDFSGYGKIMLASAGIQYREVRGPESGSTRTMPLTSTQSEFPLSDASKQRLQETVREAFLAELTNSERFEIVDKPGRDVLILVGGMLDVVSNVPPERIGRGDIYLSQVGEATLVLEVHDSMSNRILARAVDRRAAEPMTAMPMSTVSNWAEARRLANRWATNLRTGLERLLELPAS